MVLDGMIKWFMGSKAPGPIKLEMQLLEEWMWYGLPIPALTEQFSETWDWLGEATATPPSMDQQFLEEWSS